MASVITKSGEQLFAVKAQNNEQLDIDTFIFANVVGQNSADPIDRAEGIPTGSIVHQQIVQQVGRINDNVVVYSTVLDSVTGPFDFNWVGLYSSVNDTLVAINHIPSTTKIITAPGEAGNTLNRNFGIEYSGIADLTGINVAPETWQLDFTARLAGMDELTRNLAKDMNGKNWFIDNGFKVYARETTNTFGVLSGVGYVNGLRIELEEEAILIADSYPKNVYVDAYFDGDASSAWKPKHTISITSEELNDYIDVNGKQHYVIKIAKLIGTDEVEDLRTLEGLSGKIDQTARYTTIDEINKGKFKKVGTKLIVTDRCNALFEIKNAGSFDGFGAINAKNDLIAVIKKSNKMYVEMFGVSQQNDIATNTQAYHAAFDFMAGSVVYQQNKAYTYEGSYSGNVNLCGDQRPVISDSRGSVENGSIMDGTTNFSGQCVYFCNIGTDHGVDKFPSSGADAFKASASPYNSGKLCVLHGVVALGRNDTDPYHSILVEGYESFWVKECVGVKNQFSGAIKSRFGVVDGFRAIGGTNGLIVKSDSGGAAGSVNDITVSNITHEGSAASEHTLRVLADNAALKKITINGVHGTNTDRLLTIEGASAVSEVNVSNLTGSEIRKFGIVTSGLLYNVNYTNVNLTELHDYAGQLLSGSHVVMSNCYFSLKSTSPHIKSALRVESGCTSFSTTDLDIVVNRDNGVKGSIYFTNASSQNHLTNVRATIDGDIPEPGFYAEDVDDGIITPIFNGDTNHTIIDLNATAARTITEIVTTMPNSSVPFPRGYRLTMRSTGQTITFNNGANMRSKSGGNPVRQVNQLIEWVWFGNSWHQSDS